MSMFSRLFSKKNDPKSYAYRLEKARSLHGQPVKYVTERRDDNEDVIGRGGALAVHGDTFIIDSSGDRLFVCNIADLEVDDGEFKFNTNTLGSYVFSDTQLVTE